MHCVKPEDQPTLKHPHFKNHVIKVSHSSRLLLQVCTFTNSHLGSMNVDTSELCLSVPCGIIMCQLTTCSVCLFLKVVCTLVLSRVCRNLHWSFSDLFKKSILMCHMFNFYVHQTLSQLCQPPCLPKSMKKSWGRTFKEKGCIPQFLATIHNSMQPLKKTHQRCHQSSLLLDLENSQNMYVYTCEFLSFTS